MPRVKGSGAGWVWARRRKDGTRSYTLCWYDAGGTLRREACPAARTKAEAEKLLSAKREQVWRQRNGLEVPRAPATFGRAASLYLADLEPREAYRGATRKALKWALEAWADRVLADITPPDVKQLLYSREAALGTRRRWRQVIAAVFNFAERELSSGVRNPAQGRLLPSEPPPDPQSPAPDSVAAAITRMPPHVADYFLALALSGARPAEGCGWKTAEVGADLAGTQVRILRSYARDTTKTRKPRLIPLTGALREVLARAVARASEAGWEWLFATRDGSPRQPKSNSLRISLERAIAEAGIEERFTPKQLRKMVAKMVASSGPEGLALARALLGHSTERMTLEHYAGRASQIEPLRQALESVKLPIARA